MGHHGIVVLAACVLIALPARAQSTLRSPLGPSPISPNKGLPLGDVDGDGLLDVVKPLTSGLELHFGQLDGSFGPAVVAGTSPEPRNGVLADLDGDGLADLVLTLMNWAQLQVRLALGGGAFGPPTTLAVAGVSTGLVVADADGDGELDLVSASSSETRVSFLAGLGGGSFAPASYDVAPKDVTEMQGGDCNGDGRLDLTLGTANPFVLGKLYGMLGDQQGAWGPPEQVGESIVSFAMLDTDGDGRDEIAWYQAGSGPARLAVLACDPRAGFGTPLLLTPPITADFLAAGEFTGDGRADLLLIQQGFGNVYPRSVVPQSASGGLDPDASVTMFTSVGISPLSIGDVDGDGIDDVVGHNGAQGMLSAVLMQNTGEPRQLVAEDDDLRDVAIGDVDADGRADFIAAVDDTPSLRLRAGLPGGALGPSQPLDLGVAVGRLFADDSDHDGDADLLLVGTTAAGGVRWAQATGGFSFAAGPVTTLPFAPVAADAADVDGDGDLDLLLAGGDPMQLLVLLHDGAGGFSSLAAVGLHGAAVDVAAGDFDGTGYRDAAVLNAAGRVDVVRLASTGAVGTSSSAAGQAALHLAAGDVDGDGLTDVVTTAFLGDGKPATPIWFRGLGTGELAPGVPSTDKNLNSANDVAIVDFAGDGLPEVVVTRDGGVYRTGLARPVGGSLVLAEAYVQPADTSRALAADMDGDALVDLLLWGQYDTLLLLSRLGPWEALGHSLTGSAGLSRLVGEGSLLPGSIVRLTLEGASPVAPATLVLSTSASFTPFKGGVLVPTAQFVVPGLFTDASGALALQGDWPAGVPAGTQLVAQVWMLDALGPQGASASNGVRATAP